MKILQSSKAITGMAVGAMILALVPVMPLQAERPPSPKKVVRKVGDGISGFFYRLSRALEGDPGPTVRRAPSRSRYIAPPPPGPYYDRDPYDPEFYPPPGYERGPLPNMGRRPTVEEEEVLELEAANRAAREWELRSRTQQKPAQPPVVPDMATEPDLTPKAPSPPPSSTTKPQKEQVTPAPQPNAESQAPPLKSTAPSAKLPFATPVPGQTGFVYPPGVKHITSNMLDVRGLASGQKARDPRTGATFLVP